MANSYDVYPRVIQALEFISQGETTTSACDMAGVSIAQFERYIDRDDTLIEMRNEAERRGHDALADALLAPDNHRLYGHTDPKMAKVQSDNIKWFLSKKDPKRFGDKIEHTHTITADRAIIDALNAARNRVAALPGPVIDDAVYEVVDDEIEALLR